MLTRKNGRAGLQTGKEFELLNRQHGVVLTDHLSLWMIELPKFTKTLVQLSGPLDHWLYFLRHATELDADHLPAPLDHNPLIRQAMEDLMELSQTDLERERYEARLKFQRDESTLRNWASRQRQEGRQEGVRESLTRFIHRFEERLGRPRTPEPELASKTAAQLQEIADQLEAELFSRS